ncbi:MAG: translation initiation factor IF-2 [Thermoplasmata archaeon]|nr:MAG: translation initiation factor IF-2 [Thermoplasmata archaeon]
MDEGQACYIRQPIVSVLGHVDHGKTTLLDYIRGSAVAKKEAGAITQHIGATEVPIDIIYDLCGALLSKKKFTVPGLLFIDTPGHHAFTTLRARGGALADLAVLVIDINDGIMPQTLEAINILKKYRTPFVVAVNKIDTIQGWKREEGVIQHRLDKQGSIAKKIFEKKLYEIIESLFEQGFSSERYDRIRNFQRNVAIIPISAKTGEGIPELLMVLVGLAQRFLEKELATERGPAEGTVLEVKEEKGLGTTIDVIIYNGIIRQNDTIVIGGKSKPCVTTIRALLKPKPLDEIRDPSEKFEMVKEASAATGVKIAAPGLEEVFAGAPLLVAENVEECLEKIKDEMKIDIKTADEGVILKADAVGSLEALAFIFSSVPIRKAEVGDISKRDIVEASTNADPLNKVVLGFNVKVLPEAESEVRSHDVMIINKNIIYQLLEEFEKWKEKRMKKIEEEKRKEIVHPGMVLFLPNCTFRVSKPAIIGVRVLAGEIRPEQKLMREDGKIVGKIKSIQHEKKTLSKAHQGMEVAISLEGATVGRQIKPEQILYVDIPADAAKKLSSMSLSPDERDVLEKIFKIKRAENKFWGT